MGIDINQKIGVATIESPLVQKNNSENNPGGTSTGGYFPGSDTEKSHRWRRPHVRQRWSRWVSVGFYPETKTNENRDAHHKHRAQRNLKAKNAPPLRAARR